MMEASVRRTQSRGAEISPMQPRGTGLSGRQVLRVGGLGAFGLSLARLFQAQAASKPPSSLPPLNGCILVFYYGGPSHLDTWDLKPSAPREVRGEFKPIAT